MTVTCGYSPSAGVFYYEVTATDQATSAVTTTSSPSAAVTVNSALGTPGTPTGTTPIDQGQIETVAADVSDVDGTGSGTLMYAPLASTSPYTSWVATGAT